ncbi:hypothetical protein [Sphingomonas sp. CARO-RG-8B-R24-01]|uniref:hypothetical protein n=1 Tax=Sphingomonas sp. CARO-RG-8B-R24-01 TaxID=2914831 RepID=UPI001F5621C2|nr:hypothetical protein [Sphingomonas sp. CARO-RG-8B-R24-01]
MTRAYSVLKIKAVNEGARTVKGIATTPSVDRAGDIIDPLGVRFANPLPFLWQHRHDQPIGTCEFGQPTANGIPFTATIAKARDRAGAGRAAGAQVSHQRWVANGLATDAGQGDSRVAVKSIDAL